MSDGNFRFARGNLEKLLAIPRYLISVVVSWFVPRDDRRWAFGSGIGVAEGALALARQLRAADSAAEIVWLVADDQEAELARSEGFTPVLRRGRAGYWATLRARTLVVTHGLGDVNRFGVFGGTVVQLWHGAPLKRLHLDSPVTTAVRGPAIVRRLLKRMYLSGAGQVDLFVAGSPLAADRLRSAFRVDPGRVAVLGDPRDDELALQIADTERRDAVTRRVREMLGLTESTAEGESLVLYAPTWRDGAGDPGVPTPEEVSALHATLEAVQARLVLRPHPLGAGAYADVLGPRVHLLDTVMARDLTPLLGAFDALVTDYSSAAVDFSLFARPIVWFAPDLDRYTQSRGLYEPLEVTSDRRVAADWAGVSDQLMSVLPSHGSGRRSAAARSRALAARFHTFPEGGAAARVLDRIVQLRRSDAELIPEGAIFFESFYGTQVGCNPLALDREIARRFPEVPRYWSVTSEQQRVPDGATAVLVGGREWRAARRRARLLIVNDWVRRGFSPRRQQTVVQTWHGTMLKHLALGRPNVGLRTRIAIRRESRKWDLLLSQNPHATEQFRSSYAFRGPVIETGYPRDDALANAVLGPHALNPVSVRAARQALGIADEQHVCVYAPTWRDRGITLVDELDVVALAEELGDGWTVVVRGHTRTLGFGTYGRGHPRVVDASRHPDVNDVILAADLLVTDYSSIMFDAAITQIPMLFFVPDLAAYRDRERGFTFDFEREAPGPLLTTRDEVVAHAAAIAQDAAHAGWVQRYAPASAAWRARFAPHDDGHAAERVVDELIERGAIG
ncbi:hypothetical protein GCM10009847_14460 [Leucobacter tardus]|uniref:CDP-glycerol glycerophosphotransferase family protein n=1 Tax=Leucobacter tardus TaxID=501483 RepID=A0A939QD73_9MICO|nr:CDP-glycerol glycerophosphotransferase family protein [Leucobacter tardus]MBO2989632.1 CDP-glycerol glycerophosphotransferase family protein [Leucobacter tardus]